jgi:pimeloyl-ACP methyl ester carboxylesterase
MVAKWVSPLSIGIAVGLVLCAPVTSSAQTEVSFETSDGGLVHADLYGAGDRAVVMAHGGRFTKESWRDQAEALTVAGFRVLALDFRGRGSSRAGSAGAEGVRFDVLAAVRYLHANGARSVSVVGASFGGGAAAEAAAEAEPGEIERIVLLAHSSIDHPERISGRKLFIVSRGDTTGTGRLRLDDIRDQYQRAPDPKELVLLDGAAHAQFLFETDQGPRLLREILRFLSAR